MNIDKINSIFGTLTNIAIDVEPVSRAKISACVFYKKKIVSIGYCQWKTHPFQVKYQRNEHSCFLHAENDAIRKALNRIHEDDLKKCSLFVCRVKQNHKGYLQYGLAKPCMGCQECIDRYRIKNVFYTLTTKDVNKIEFGTMQ